MSENIESIVVTSSGVLGGRPHIDGTRVSVQTITILYKRGYSQEEIADQYEHLSLAQTYAALAYYHANRSEIESDIAREDAQYDQLEEKHLEARKDL